VASGERWTASALLIAAGLTVLGVKVAGSTWVALGVVGGIGIFVMVVAGARGFDPGSTTWFVVGAGLVVISSLGCSIGMRRTQLQRVDAWAIVGLLSEIGRPRNVHPD
jgi:hypothetical protein